MEEQVLVEVDSQGNILRILKNRKQTRSLPTETVLEVSRTFAVGEIRRQVFLRAGCTPNKPGECEWCGELIVWNRGSSKSGHLHEKTFRSNGGEISLENSVAICRNCHLGLHGAHGNRRWHTAKIKERYSGHL
jgi:5-methylcytosine-specific restriction endonuclease McrA